MRVFQDTNVLVSAVAAHGLCAEVLRVVLTEHELISSEVVREEVQRVLRDKLGVPAALVSEALGILDGHFCAPRPQAPAEAPIADEADCWVLASAENGHPDVIVTGDKELLGLGVWAGIPIVAPRGFWQMLRSG